LAFGIQTVTDCVALLGACSCTNRVAPPLPVGVSAALASAVTPARQAVAIVNRDKWTTLLMSIDFIGLTFF
jgi:hypothetical protein